VYPKRPGAAGVEAVHGMAGSVQEATHGAQVVVEGVAGGTLPVGKSSVEVETTRIHELVEHGSGSTRSQHLAPVLEEVQEQQDLRSHARWRY
jgi:hypothetical protein